MFVVLSVPIPDDMLARMDALVAEQAVSRDEILQAALAEFLETRSVGQVELLPWQEAKVQRGLAAAARDDFASDDEVDQIFARYGA